MGSEGAQLVEGPAALVADVGPGVAVDVQLVLLQAVVAGEGGGAGVALEGPLPGVLVAMQREAPSLGERLAARLALVALLRVVLLRPV